MYVCTGHGQCWFFWPVFMGGCIDIFFSTCAFFFLGMSEGMFVCMCHSSFVFLSL